MNYLKLAADKIQEKSDPNTAYRNNLVKALKESACINGQSSSIPFDEPQNTLGPEDILRNNEITLKQAFNVKLFLTRREAVEFLNSHLRHDISYKEFNDRSGYKMYSTMFRRNISKKAGMNVNIYTYAEVLIIAECRKTLPFPYEF